MSEFNDVTCPTCGHSYGYHAWQEMQQQREEIETARHIRDFAKLTREVHKRQQAEMPEPTIEDLLKWLFVVNKYLAGTGSDISSSREVQAISAILEHHEKLCDTAERIKLAAIRAFVERVEKRIAGEEAVTYFVAITQELNEMEKEAKTCQEE